MTVTIRPLEERDWPQVHAIVVEVASAGETYAMDVPADEAATRAFWVGQSVVVAVDGETVLGSAKMGPNRPAQGAHVGTASFMVGSVARGRGVGRLLGEHVVAWHRDAGFRGIQFNAVVATNVAAVRLWRSLGFEVVGTLPGAFALPGGSLADLLLMHLDLAPDDDGPDHGGPDAVLVAAAEVFVRRGWSRATLAEVADRAGVRVEDVERRYASKADLLMMTMRHVGFRGESLLDAYAAYGLDATAEVDERLERAAQFVLGVVQRVTPLVRVLWVAADEDPVAAALRQGTELRRVAMSRSLAELLRRGEESAADAVGSVQALANVETYMCLKALGWSDERYAAWLARALDNAVNGPHRQR